MISLMKSFSRIIQIVIFSAWFSSITVKGVKNIRLAGSTKPLEGRVEVYRLGEWGRVCMLRKYGSSFTDDNLNVVCRELGFVRGVAVTSNYPGTGRVWLENVQCSGNEKTITGCFHYVKSTGNPYCIDNKDVSVECDICNSPLLSNANLVHDWSFRATSYKDGNPPHFARLKSPAAWCLHPLVDLRAHHYLEIELPRLYLVSAVATLGGVTGADYVKSYFVEYRAESMQWDNVAFVEQKAIIEGNSQSGNENVVKRIFDQALRTKFVRFRPRKWGSLACMRVEICGRALPHNPVISVTRIASTSIVTSWSEPDPGDDDIKKYYIRYWKVKEGKRSEKMFTTSATAFILSYLSPATEYEIQVSAVTNLGEGLRSSYFERTFEAAPSGPPTQLQATFVGTTAVNITWAPPQEDKRNGKITGYNVAVCAMVMTQYIDENCQTKLTSAELPGSQKWFVLRDVDFTAQYLVQVNARTLSGSGPKGEVTTGVLEYTAPDGRSSSLTMAIVPAVLLLGLIIVIILAAKGIIFKNFVHALRKLTRSQATISTRSSKEAKKKESYDKPDETPNAPEAPLDDLYKSSPSPNTDEIYGTLADTSVDMTSADDIYRTSKGMSQNPDQQPLYKSNDENVTCGDHVGIYTIPSIKIDLVEDLPDSDSEGYGNEDYGNEPTDTYEQHTSDQEGKPDPLGSVEISFSEENKLDDVYDIDKACEEIEELFDCGVVPIPRPRVQAPFDETTYNEDNQSPAELEKDDFGLDDLDSVDFSHDLSEFEDVTTC